MVPRTKAIRNLPRLSVSPAISSKSLSKTSPNSLNSPNSPNSHTSLTTRSFTTSIRATHPFSTTTDTIPRSTTTDAIPRSLKPPILPSLPFPSTTAPIPTTSDPISSTTSPISSTTVPTPSAVTATSVSDITKHARGTLSAGPIAGVVIGSILSLAIGICIFSHIYRRQRGRRHQEEEEGRVSPLQYKAPVDADLNTVLVVDPGGIKLEEKGHQIGFIPAAEPIPTSQFPQAEPPPTHPSEPNLIASSTQRVRENIVNQDGGGMRAQVVRMRVTISSIVEQIQHLETQLDATGDVNSATPPPTYISS